MQICIHINFSGMYLNIVTSVECLQVELPVWLGRPQTQVDGVVGVEARDGVVIGNSCHLHTCTDSDRFRHSAGLQRVNITL